MSDDDTIKPFQPLGDYEWPALPADKAFGRVLSRLREMVRPTKAETPLVADEDLNRLKARQLDQIAAPPACGPLLAELDVTFDDWLATTDAGRNLQVVVMPPCEESGILRVWAGRRGLRVLDAPARHDLLNRDPDSIARHLDDLLVGRDIIVIPALENWFVRSADGLATVRALLTALSRADRRCLLGCNSWAFGFLTKAVDAGAILPTPLTFQAFDGPRLQAWFHDLSSEVEQETGARFRLSGSGVDVFDTTASGREDYFVQLAATALGIPWVAWRIWRSAIRDLPDPEDVQDSDRVPGDDGKTFWIVAPSPHSLPVESGDETLMALHALLIHGAMTEDDLNQVLPVVGQRNTLAVLLRAGMIRQVENTDRYMCNPVAYPAIRKALSDTGFNLDRL